MKFDLAHVSKYMLEYDIGVPPGVIVGVLLFVCAIVLLLFLYRINYLIFVRQASICLLVGYVFLVLCTTLLYREETFVKRYHLCPLWSYTELYNNIFAQLIMNIMMFIPIGFFLGGALKKKHLWNALEISFVLSLFIELTQLITTRGVFNVDDIIHNVLGCAIGFFCFVLCYKAIKKAA